MYYIKFVERDEEIGLYGRDDEKKYFQWSMADDNTKYR